MSKARALTITEFGNPLLRQTARKLSSQEIQSQPIQQLIANMRHTLIEKKLGIGLAAPQVGKQVAVVVICIRPLPHRRNIKPFNAVLINPKITAKSEKVQPLWEGCISSGSQKAGLFAKVPRNSVIEIEYNDETGKRCKQTFKSLRAQVVQHELDHLEGILFVDHVRDTKSYMTYGEYKKRIAKNK